MAFAQPLFLIALAGLAIPVIIHLFNFRRYKKVYFTNVSFIADIKQESKKRSQLKHLLILLMRLLSHCASETDAAWRSRSLGSISRTRAPVTVGTLFQVLLSSPRCSVTP